MNANEVIESYVTDVAVQLSRRQRNDVAFELRALLTEGLQDKAEAAGRAADAAMATELVQAFGRPAEVAARYRPTLTIIDPVDGPGFLRAVVIGLAIIWSVGLLVRRRQPIDSAGGLLTVLGGWWAGTVIPSLWWPGLLVVGFGLASWARRRWPSSAEWKPRAGDRVQGGTAAMIMAVVGILAGLFVLLDPRVVLDVLFGGRAAPAAYEAFRYTETFRQRQGPVLVALIALNLPLFIAVIVKGRWSAVLRRIQIGLGLVTCTVLAWTLLDGPVFAAPAGNQVVKPVLVLIIALTLVSLSIRLHRSVRPAPDQQSQ